MMIFVALIRDSWHYHIPLWNMIIMVGLMFALKWQFLFEKEAEKL